MNTRLPETHGDEPSPVLYAHLLGPAWLELPNCLQNLHQSSVSVHGRFEVRHGSPVTSLVARWLKLPQPATSVDLTLIVERCGQAEKWIRRFGSHTITTIQWAGANHLLRERFGIVELGFELRIENGGLIYHQRRAAGSLTDGALFIADPTLACAPRHRYGKTFQRL